MRHKRRVLAERGVDKHALLNNVPPQLLVGRREQRALVRELSGTRLGFGQRGGLLLETRGETVLGTLGALALRGLGFDAGLEVLDV